MRSLAALAPAACSAAVLLAGCGGGSDALNRETAMEHAMNAVATEVRDPGSPVYRHRIQLRNAVPHGDGGWLVRIADRSAGATICVVDLPTATAVGTTENIAIVPCAAPRPPAPPAPEPAPGSSA